MTLRPTLAGFIAFAQTDMGIPASALDPASVYYQWAYAAAIDIVSHRIAQASPVLYVIAVYNLAGDTLLNIAQDPPGQTTFAGWRRDFGLNSFVAGVVAGAGDNGTSDTLVVPDALKTLTLSNLQNLKTPYGRTYLSIAQRVGTVWGIS